MDAFAAAQASAPAVSTIASHFMLAGSTYKKGAELGFEGLDFYVAGRGGVLGDVDADVVTAAFAFFEPTHIRAQWEKGLGVMSAAEAGRAFAACSSDWAAEQVPAELGAGRLAELAGRVASSARAACAPVFAGWRTLEVPSEPAAAAVHQLNALRELRLGLHASCIVASGLAPLEAMTIKTPQMAPVFGWAELPEVDDAMRARWDEAEANTDRAMAHAYEALSDTERDELVDLARQLHAATSA